MFGIGHTYPNRRRDFFPSFEKLRIALQNVHEFTRSVKVSSWKFKILKRGCFIYKADLDSGTHSTYRYLMQDGQRQQVHPKHQHKYQTTSHLLVFGWRRTQQSSRICLLWTWWCNDRYLCCYTCNLISLPPYEWLTPRFLLESFTGQKLTNYLYMLSQPEDCKHGLCITIMQWQVFVLLHLQSDIFSTIRMTHSKISAWKFHWPETNKLSVHGVTTLRTVHMVCV